MRKIIVVEFMSLDGVTQAPGGPGEDTSGSFKYGGWLAPYSDQAFGEALGATYGQPYDLLLGRKTYDIFAAYWPHVKIEDEGTRKFADGFNSCRKYVATHSPDTLNWQNSEALGSDIVQSIQKIKQSSDKNLLVVGSSNFAHTLLANDLVDELHLLIAPIILGKGKRLFDEASRPRALKLSRSVISTTGVLLTQYTRGGEIQTGSVGPKD
jgi:dihydrofolate reductase